MGTIGGKCTDCRFMELGHIASGQPMVCDVCRARRVRERDRILARQEAEAAKRAKDLVAHLAKQRAQRVRSRARNIARFRREKARVPRIVIAAQSGIPFALLG